MRILEKREEIHNFRNGIDARIENFGAENLIANCCSKVFDSSLIRARDAQIQRVCDGRVKVLTENQRLAV